MPSQTVDLHCHSTCSDGLLSPSDLVRRAHDNGVRFLALTDHDTMAGISEAQQTASQLENIQIIPGIELSARYPETEIHILGLGMDASHPAMQDLIESQQAARWQRAQQMGELLAKRNIKHSFALAADLSKPGPPGRAHFAQALINQGAVRNFSQAFRQFLGDGKPCFVETEWASYKTIIATIQAAKGGAYLAHPAGYQLSKTKLRSLIRDFAEAGGDGLEVVSGKQEATQAEFLYRQALLFNLSMSFGSDFHGPNPQTDLGDYPVADLLQPILSRWESYESSTSHSS